MDVAFRLLVKWASQTPQEMDRLIAVFAHFRNLETEYETGEIVLPSWASLGDVAAHYSIDDTSPPAAPVADQ